MLYVLLLVGNHTRAKWRTRLRLKLQSQKIEQIKKLAPLDGITELPDQATVKQSLPYL